MDEEDERGSQQGEEAEEELNIPEMWKYALQDQVGRIVKYLSAKEDEELAEAVQELNPEDHASLLLWATLRNKFVLVEWLLKKCKRDAFAFRDKPLLAVYDKWVEERKAKEERDREAAEEAAARAAEGVAEDEEEEKEPEPELYQTVLEGVEGDNIDVYVVRSIGELGLYEGGRDAQGNKSGVGQSLFVNGDMYVGEYSNNKREGTGTYFWTSRGLIYNGQWKNNQRSGMGRMVYSDGGRYFGQWLFDKKNGRGRYTYPNGDVYNGDWVDDVKEGVGTYTFAADSSQYVGTYRAGEFTSGKWLLAGNRTYYGAFKQYKPVGKGVFVFGGKFKQEGVYRAGRWYPTKVDNVKTSEGVNLVIHVQGSPIELRFAPELSSKYNVEHLVAVANFKPFEQWLESLERQGRILVKDIRIQSLQLVAPGLEVQSVSLKLDVYDFAKGPASPKLPDDVITLQAPEEVLAVMLRCEGRDYLIGVQEPLLSVGDFDHLQLPRAKLDAAGAFQGPHTKKIADIFGLRLHRDSMMNLSETFFGKGRPRLFTSIGHHNDQFTMWLYRQEVHSDYFNRLAEKLEEHNRRGDFVKVVMHEAEKFMDLVNGTRCCTVLALLDTMADRIPQQTVMPQRPPTPPPPDPEPVPIYTAEELALQQAALEAELAAKNKAKRAEEEVPEDAEEE
eukprot:GGOE01062168.1.p1 GENE.GGOE01062168.1~~GGOE01062168.1.p1  ORF type:complete len:686 (-),score=253.45 GGOE01062168.1:247-2262(-)